MGHENLNMAHVYTKGEYAGHFMKFGGCHISIHVNISWFFSNLNIIYMSMRGHGVLQLCGHLFFKLIVFPLHARIERVIRYKVSAVTTQ